MKRLIRSLIFGYLLVFPFGQLARLPFGFSPEVRIYLTDIFVFLIVTFWGIWRIKTKKEKKEKPDLFWPILAFIGAAALSLLVNVPRLAEKEILVASLYLLRFVFYAGIYLVAWDIENFKFQISNFKLKLPALLMFVGGLSATFGLLQYLLFPDTRSLAAYDWDPHYYRVIGTFLDPGFLGMIMVLTIVLVICQLWEDKSEARSTKSETNSNDKNFNAQNKKILNFENLNLDIISNFARLASRSKREFRISNFFLLVISYLCLMLTYSRSSYFAYLIGMAVIAWAKRAPKFFLTVLLIFILTILVLPRPGGEGVKLERESTVQARIRNWKQSLVIARDHPIFGVGFNAYRYAQRDYGFLGKDWQTSHAGAGADSSILFVMATTGLVGLAVYLWFWVSLLRVTRYGLVALASSLALLAHSFFNNSLFYPWIMVWFWVLLGLRRDD